MSNDRQTSLKDRIVNELETLRVSVAEREKDVAPVEPDVSIGRLSRLDTMLNQGISESTLSQARVRILKLEAALRRLENDEDFGYCMECGAAIPTPRLLALPETEFCVDCAE